MLEVGLLAASIVSSFLVPLIKDGAEQLKSKLMEEASEGTANGLVATAKSLWDKVCGKSEGDDAKIVELFQKTPDKMSSALEAVVKDLLESDPQLRKEISAMVETEEEGSPRWQLMGTYVAAVDARHARISGNAVVAGMQVGLPAPQKGQAPQEE